MRELGSHSEWAQVLRTAPCPPAVRCSSGGRGRTPSDPPCGSAIWDEGGVGGPALLLWLPRDPLRNTISEPKPLRIISPLTGRWRWGQGSYWSLKAPPGWGTPLAQSWHTADQQRLHWEGAGDSLKPGVLCLFVLGGSPLGMAGTAGCPPALDASPPPPHRRCGDILFLCVNR